MIDDPTFSNRLTRIGDGLAGRLDFSLTNVGSRDHVANLESFDARPIIPR
ncbi:hypothetical protein [Inquilinus sp. CAU 1745]